MLCPPSGGRFVPRAEVISSLQSSLILLVVQNESVPGSETALALNYSMVQVILEIHNHQV